METKEELKKQFEVRFPYLDSADISMIFDFFYSEIEAREKEIKTLTLENNDLECKNEDMENIDSEQVTELKAKISRLETTLKMADEALSICPANYRSDGVGFAFGKALKKYNQQKQSNVNQQSPNS